MNAEPGLALTESARWEAAAQVRKQRPGWVVIWLARKGEYRVQPLFRAPPGTVATGATPGELIACMDAVRQAISHRPKRPARA